MESPRLSSGLPSSCIIAHSLWMAPAVPVTALRCAGLHKIPHKILPNALTRWAYKMRAGRDCGMCHRSCQSRHFKIGEGLLQQIKICPTASKEAMDKWGPHPNIPKNEEPNNGHHKTEGKTYGETPPPSTPCAVIRTRGDGCRGSWAHAF